MLRRQIPDAIVLDVATLCFIAMAFGVIYSAMQVAR